MSRSAHKLEMMDYQGTTYVTSRSVIAMLRDLGKVDPVFNVVAFELENQLLLMKKVRDQFSEGEIGG